MEYLENAFKFWGKYIFLIVPLFIMNSVIIFLGSPAIKEISNVLNEIAEITMDTGETANIDLYDVLVQITPNILSIVYVVLLALLLSAFILPATYGMIIKGYETAKTGLGSFFTSLKKYFTKFIPYLFTVLLFIVAVGIIYTIVLFIFPFIYSISWQLGLAVFAGIIIASIIILCHIFNVFNIWFIAMAWDDMKVFEGLIKAFKLVKSYFWSSIGITFAMGFLYVTIIALIGGVIENVFIVGATIKSFLLSACIYILMVFGFEIYRDRTNKKTQLRDYL